MEDPLMCLQWSLDKVFETWLDFLDGKEGDLRIKIEIISPKEEPLPPCPSPAFPFFHPSPTPTTAIAINDPKDYIEYCTVISQHAGIVPPCEISPTVVGKLIGEPLFSSKCYRGYSFQGDVYKMVKTSTSLNTWDDFMENVDQRPSIELHVITPIVLALSKMGMCFKDAVRCVVADLPFAAHSGPSITTKLTQHIRRLWEQNSDLTEMMSRRVTKSDPEEVVKMKAKNAVPIKRRGYDRDVPEVDDPESFIERLLKNPHDTTIYPTNPKTNERVDPAKLQRRLLNDPNLEAKIRSIARKHVLNELKHTNRAGRKRKLDSLHDVEISEPKSPKRF